MSIASKYDPALIEDKWYSFWLENKFFHSVPDEREPYTIVIPPPNVTGVLHMGHMLNNTIQDVLVRHARMQGKNACWVPGTDHASIATEAKVVKMLEEKGISKKDISREEFLKYAWEWKEKYGGIILEQLKKLGASCDWDRTRFTMEPSLSDAVSDVFIDLFEKKLIYRGTRMVNWDPLGKTTLSDEEVIFKEINEFLYYVKYQIEGSSDFLSVATARPETIAGDVALCVNPADERYKKLIGKNVIVPLINKVVPIIADDYIDIEFGTGILKVTPAHDIHDYTIGLKNNLPVYDTLNDDGTISEQGLLYVGKDRFEARKLWVEDLAKAGLLEKTQEYTHNVGFSERTNAIVEPKISTQWFVDMQKFLEKNPAVLNSVMDGEIQFHPSRFKNTYKHWITNIKDWNISRQLWWGHRIPAWYASNGTFKIAKTAEEAAHLFQADGINLTSKDLSQDEDVLDTWFSSWLWPISVFDGLDKNNSEIDYYYPTNDLVTAPEIIFFWVARMIMAGYEYRAKPPFKNVYFTGIVRDKKRKKMSKSLGNSPDPLDLIAKHGADAVRMGMLLCSPAGNDILFDESQIEQGRNFCNKLWNANRLIQSWNITTDFSSRENEVQACNWFALKLNNAIQEINTNLEVFRLNDALMCLYKLIWDDFCSILLEAVKPPFGEQVPQDTYKKVNQYFDTLLALLHPFMPFISEELHHQIHSGADVTPVVISPYPKFLSGLPLASDEPLQVVAEIRNIRNLKNIAPKETLQIVIKTEDKIYLENKAFIEKLANCILDFNGEISNTALSAMAGTAEIFVSINSKINTSEEIKRIKEEIDYLNGFLISVNAKLSNEKFVANANAAVVDREQQKRTDAEQKINSLKRQLDLLATSS